jgi:hypothetical protein
MKKPSVAKKKANKTVPEQAGYRDGWRAGSESMQIVQSVIAQSAGQGKPPPSL